MKRNIIALIVFSKYDCYAIESFNIITQTICFSSVENINPNFTINQPAGMALE